MAKEVGNTAVGAKGLTALLSSKGFTPGYQSGGEAPPGLTPREVQKEPTPRARALRDLYFQTLSSVSLEFPYWYTRRWQQLEGEVPVVRRAEALKTAFSHMTPTIYPEERLVGGKTIYYRGSFPMPWLSEGYFMAVQDQLYQAAIEKGSAAADQVTKWGSGGGNVTENFGSAVSIAGKFGIPRQEVPALLKLARAWVGKSVDDVGHKYEQMIPDYPLKENLMRSVICMFDSGYTLPQGREVTNYYFPLQHGLDGVKEIARTHMSEVAGEAGGDGLRGMDRLYFYQASILVLEGIQSWIGNYAKEARRLQQESEDLTGQDEYGELADSLEWIACRQPRTFCEALQLIFLLHTAVLNEDCISGLSPGRVGQVLWPWFEQDREAGRLGEKEALELLELYRVKMTCYDCFAAMGVVGGVLSGNTFNHLCLGGLAKDGGSAANPLEMLILEAGMTCATPQPTLGLLYHECLPEGLLLQAIECNKTGTGYPAWLNDEVARTFLLRQYGPEGMDVEEARAWSVGGCLETSPGSWHELTLVGRRYWIPGGSGQPTSVGVHFLSLPKILECVLFNGRDMRRGVQVFPPHDRHLATYEELWETFCAYFEVAVQVLCRANNIQHDIWRKQNMPVLHSLLKPDCLETGYHIGNLGYRYNATYNVESCGTANLVNALAALKTCVYQEKRHTLEDVRQAILANFGFQTAEEVGSYSLAAQELRPGGEVWEEVHHDLLTAPKYGNDDPQSDCILAQWEQYFSTVARCFQSLYGFPLYPCQISVSTHGPMGAVTLAGPDGRLAGTTFADGSMSAYPGTDRNGPYALFASATCWDHSRSQNSQMNLKIHPSAARGAQGARKLLELTRAYLRQGAFHIQYNIVDSKVLKDAQAHPENYRTLMVRVAGFTQYWVEIGKAIQDEVIARTEYESV